MLGILFLIVVVILGIGSYLYLKDNKPSTPAFESPLPISIDKSNFREGEILVTFKPGTKYQNIEDVFVQNSMSVYSHTSGKVFSPSNLVSGTDVFVVSVNPSFEQDAISKLLSSPVVATASLRYN